MAERFDLQDRPLRKTEQARATIAAARKGYRVLEDGSVVGVRGPVVTTQDTRGYHRVNVYYAKGKRRPVLVHQLCALLKYGDIALREGVVVRHLNGDCCDNRPANIAIGTQSENMMDRDRSRRVAHARLAASHQRKLTDAQVVAMRRERERGTPLKVLCERYSMSKGAVSFIVNRITYADVD